MVVKLAGLLTGSLYISSLSNLFFSDTLKNVFSETNVKKTKQNSVDTMCLYTVTSEWLDTLNRLMWTKWTLTFF